MKHDPVAALAQLDEAELRRALTGLPEADRRALEAHWPIWAHAGQTPPHDDWRQWVLLAGRGFGKTKAGAEYVSQYARDHPGAAIALIGATLDEARAVMVEGRSGLIAVARAGERRAMTWTTSRRRLVFASGAEAVLYSAANPESLRGPEHHLAWCDEFAKWRRAKAAWDNLRLGLRLGDRPKALFSTTPRATAALRLILALPGTVLTGGATRDNAHLSKDFIAAVEEAHAGTRFGRQELDGILIEDVEGALWTREGIENGRAAMPAADDLVRVVIGLDPPASAHGDECGIVVCGLGPDGIAYVLDDRSAGGLSPEGWGRAVALAAEVWEADLVVAETNQGGEMVERVLLGVDAALPVLPVRARLGKGKRAEPVSTWFARGRAKLAGRFPALEDQLCAMTHGGGYEAPGSPDRADAMVWAMTELLDAPAMVPRIIVL